MKNLSMLLCALLVAVSASACEDKAVEPVEGEAEQAQTTGVRVEVATKAPYGEFLVTGDEQSLYLFEPDKAGESTCYDACAEMWPPLTVEDDFAAGPGVAQDKLGVIERKTGEKQLTYAGHPLYTYVKDDEPLATTGQDIKTHGGEWYLVSPAGEKVHAEGEEHTEAAP